jgi:hypothetical protein
MDQMPTRHIDAAFVKMVAAKKALAECQGKESVDMVEERRLFRELTNATDEYVAAVDRYIAFTRSGTSSVVPQT